jgi:hypothetical protein
MMKNITLSADEEIVAKVRDYAKEHNKTLNQLIRDYLKQCVEEAERKTTVQEFLRYAQQHAGCSDEGWRFNREEIHRRGKQDE